MATGYSVISQRETTTMGADGHFHDVHEVTARTSKGTTFSVRVPNVSFTAAAVKDALDAKCAEVVAIENL